MTGYVYITKFDTIRILELHHLLVIFLGIFYRSEVALRNHESGIIVEEAKIMNTSEKVYKTLDNLSIEYENHEHPPVFTVEEANKHWEGIKGKHSKNLFLRNKKGNRHFLIVMDADKSLDIKQFQKKIGISNLSFASEKRLENYLGLTKGSVSPFGLINDENHEVEVIVDSDLVQADFVNFHPNINTATLTISAADFKRFLEQTGNKVSYQQFQQPQKN